MILGDELQDIIDVDGNLLDQLNFKNDVVVDIFLIAVLLLAQLVVEVEIDTLIILELAFRQDFIAFEFVKGGKDVANPQNGSPEPTE